ncbi:MFS transporter [Streptomyces sp. NPDC005017]|uniref:MFS transporter n=1 Tax=Streptomyces sp. NPDC005017 TaxID=3364706 RepID=UPI003686B496
MHTDPTDSAPSPKPVLTATDPVSDPRRWWILATIGVAQLMVVLDATIVNIALPSAQTDLGFSDSGRQWVVTAYAMAFGSLLLLGGRLGDMFGRRRTFLIGLTGFALSSALGGAATTFGVLVTGRVLQGLFAALLAPAALALLSTTFTDPAERGKAFGVFGAIAGSGGGVGLLLGGVLTDGLNWRWTMYVNLVFAAIAGLGALVLIRPRPTGRRPELDLPGAVLASSGLFCFVYGLSGAGSASWSSPRTWGFLAAGAVLVVAFVWWQTRTPHPLLPLRIVLDRVRGTAFLALLIGGAGIFGVLLFLTYYFQHTMGYRPVMTGLAFLPMALSITTTSMVSNIVLLPKAGFRVLVSTGMVLAACGMAGLTRLSETSPYATYVLPALIVFGVGMGLIMSPSINLGTAGIDPADIGVGSSLIKTMQQVGGSLGTALLSTIAAGTVADQLAGKTPTPQLMAEATLKSYHAAFATSAGLYALGAVVTLTMLPRKLQVPVARGAAPTGRR